MSDVLERNLQELAARLESLRPAVDEYARLTAASEALATLNGPQGASIIPPVGEGKGQSRSARSAKPRARPTARAASNRATPGRRKPARRRRRGRPKGWSTRPGEALAAIEAHPGITTAEIATKLRMKAHYLYRVLPILQKERKIIKKGNGWHPTNS